MQRDIWRLSQEHSEEGGNVHPTSARLPLTACPNQPFGTSGHGAVLGLEALGPTYGLHITWLLH